MGKHSMTVWNGKERVFQIHKVFFVAYERIHQTIERVLHGKYNLAIFDGYFLFHWEFRDWN